MIIQSLSNDQWQIRQSHTQNWYSAKVPGCVHTTLIDHQIIPDPFVGDNEKRVQWVAEMDWEYTLKFTPDSQLYEQSNIFLVCDGLDTIADVYVNEYLLGSSNDMFIRYEWDVKKHLKNGENFLKILFKSPVQTARERMSSRPLPEVTQAIPGGNYLRKAPCQFGWDWGPQLPPIGIWKDIRLIGFQTARFSDINITQIHNEKSVFLDLRIDLERYKETPLKLRVEIIDPKGMTRSEQYPIDSLATHFTNTLNILKPQLWYPNGFGAQSLYRMTFYLLSQDTILDKKQFSIGLRTIELVQEKDEWGKSFKFVVNGIPIFAKGANWIPADSFPTRITKDSLSKLLRSAVDTHQNMLRVWGGGFYETDLFYDLCDQYGILIWQDMIFSCAIYPLNDPLLLNLLKEEVKQNVKRLRHHACLALWCGNNEMEWGWEGWGWHKQEYKDLQNAYDHFFHHNLPEWIAEEDQQHPYWPSSPSSNTPFIDVNGESQGDSHYWEVWHGRKPFTAYREHFPRFMSEFGFQSLPPFDTIKTYAKPEDWNMTSYIMEHHQKNQSGNGLIIAQMTDAFRMPKDFSSLVYLSMILQAEGIRYGVEHWRRSKHRVSGTLYWQLNDCWQVASWSSLDYFGNWKALHYAARQFYAPVLLSLRDEKNKISVFVTNDMNSSIDAQIKWQLMTLDGVILESGQDEFGIAAYESRKITQREFNLTEEQFRNTVFTCDLIQDGMVTSSKMATFVPNKHLNLMNPEIEWQFEQTGSQVTIHLKSSSVARFVECSLPGHQCIFSDNYFDLVPGVEKSISLPIPANLTLSKFVEILVVRSLFDSFA